jgi:hypothetical protein
MEKRVKYHHSFISKLLHIYLTNWVCWLRLGLHGTRMLLMTQFDTKLINMIYIVTTPKSKGNSDLLSIIENSCTSGVRKSESADQDKKSLRKDTSGKSEIWYERSNIYLI